MEFISYGKQWIDDDDVEAVITTLKSDFLTQGPAVKDFEAAICEYTGAKYCVALSNATAGLHLAVSALGIKEGMEGITSPNTFVASANCLVYNNLRPVFADIEKDSYNIDPVEIRKKVTPETGVIIPVHFAGRPCNMNEIKRIADDNDLYLIEDAAHAIGSNYPDGSKVGNCKYSDMTVFSFHPVKTMTTGEGGAVTTNSKELYEKLVLLRSHGITKDADKLKENHGPWYYEMHDLGFNYRITDVQAALGISQLKKLDGFKKRRKDIITKYNSAFSNYDWIILPLVDDSDPCFHLYVVLIDYTAIKTTRSAVMQKLKDHNIGTQVLYIPVHTQPYYMDKFGYSWGDYPVAEDYYNKMLTIPLYPRMTDKEVDYVIDNIRKMVQ